jgi:chloramphenicol 3-O phosphotransferase
VPDPVRRWQTAVHVPGIYDLDVDTAALSPEACAAVIREHLDAGPPPHAFRRLAALAAPSGGAGRAPPLR